MDILSNRKSKARKDHRCDFCHSMIEKGEVYDRQVVKDQQLYTWKTHLDCTQIAHKLNMYQNAADAGYDGVNDDFFMEEINEEYRRLFDDNYDGIKRSFRERLERVIKHHKKNKIVKQ